MSSNICDCWCSVWTMTAFRVKWSVYCCTALWSAGEFLLIDILCVEPKQKQGIWSGQIHRHVTRCKNSLLVFDIYCFRAPTCHLGCANTHIGTPCLHTSHSIPQLPLEIPLCNVQHFYPSIWSSTYLIKIWCSSYTGTGTRGQQVPRYLNNVNTSPRRWLISCPTLLWENLTYFRRVLLWWWCFDKEESGDPK